jgi:NAD(P)-dependent dehydrogenase (short-subunit alcohol dehydrogenase family)
MKTMLITGGTGKVGQQLVTYFVDQNWTVITTSRSTSKLQTLKNSLSSKLFHGLEVDLLAVNSIQKIQDYLGVNKLFPNVLVNAARDIDHLGTASHLQNNRSKWLDGFALDVVVPFELSMALSQVPKTKLSSIITISSMYGMVAQNPRLYEQPQLSMTPNYGASKAASIQLTKDLAVQLAAKNIRVNSISFGGIKGRVDEAFLNRYAKLTPLHRMMEESEVIGPVAFLASDESSYLTGQNMVVDGGWTAW